MSSLNPKSLALACGSTLALGAAFLALVAMVHGAYGKTVISIMSSVYLGYDATIPGLLIGAIWGFVDGYIFGFLIALFYNVALKKPQAPLQAQTQGHGYDIMKK